MQDSLILLHLSLIENVSPKYVHALIEHKPTNLAWSSLYEMSASDFVHIFDVPFPIAQKLVTGFEKKENFEKEWDLIERHNITWLSVVDAGYPSLLSHIHTPPVGMYTQGASLSDLHKTIAIVGSRKAGGYAQAVINEIIPELVAHNWTIVSGGALGADTMAHAATLKAKGKTIAVFGSGLLNPHPVSNKGLFADIVAQGGTLVSNFPLLTEPFAANFPARNRIISGLSKGCVVVQAAKQSGALITARCALEQGRDVFAVPGLITDELSQGCHLLIQEGAKMVTCAADIAQEYGELGLSTDKQLTVTFTSDKQQELLLLAAQKSPEKKVRKPIQSNIAPFSKAPSPIPSGLSPEELIIYSCRQATSFDELIGVTKLPITTLQTLLFDLQLNGKLVQNVMGMWHIPQNQ